MGNSSISDGAVPPIDCPRPADLKAIWPEGLPACPRVMLASSGGADSLAALLWAHAQLLAGRISALRVVSINHQIHPSAAAWSRQAVAQAQHFGITADVISVQLPARSPAGHHSLEDRARATRYAALREHLAQAGAGTVLVTAHHQSDQAETFLLAALRGSSLAGLAAMPVLANFGNGWHWRPFLHTPAHELKALAQTAALPFVDDPSNLDTRFDRNFLRQTILPQLQNQFPNALAGLSQAAAQAAEDWTMLTDLARQDNGAAWSETVPMATLASISPARQANLIRGWVKAQSALMPPKTQLNEWLRQCHTAQAEQRPTLRWGQWAITRYRQQLYWREPARELSFEPIVWLDKTQPCRIHANVTLHLIRTKAGDPLALADSLLARPWRIRPRAPQDKIKRYSGQPRRDLKQWFQENNIPPWQRASVMMLEIDGELAGIVGQVLNEQYQATEQPGWQIMVEKSQKEINPTHIER